MSMLRMILVEDEPLVRIAFKSFMDWEASGFSIIGEFVNGQDALQQIDKLKPDIVVTDIMMPVMDGLQLIKETNRRGANILFLVLSSYDEFPLVKEAYNLGIYDYVLKTEMKPELLAELFARVKAHIAITRQTNMQTINSIKLVEQNKKSLREAYFKELIWGGVASSGNVPLETGQLDLRLQPRNIFVSKMNIDNFSFVERKYGEDSLQLLVFTMLNCIEEISNEYDIGDAFANSPNEYIIIFSFNKGSSEKAFKETLWNYHRRLTSVLKQYLNVSVSCGISDIMQSGYHGLFNQYKQACWALDYKFFKGNNSLIWYEEVAGLSADLDFLKMERIERLKGFLGNPDMKKLSALLTEILFTGDNLHPKSISWIKLFYESYIAILIDYAYRRQSGEKFTQLLDDYMRLKEPDTLDLLNEQLEQFLRAVCEETHGESYLVRQTKQYIYRNYPSPISLAEVAGSLNISEGHLSRIFSEQTGQSFVKYLVRVRIEKAKEYLSTTHLRIYEVAEKVGYSSTEHFSRSFKEVTGKSPKEYLKLL